MKKLMVLLMALFPISAFAVLTPTSTGSDYVNYCKDPTGNGCVFQVDVNGDMTMSGFQVMISSAPQFTSAAQQLLPIGTYILVTPVNIAANTALTGTPTISTSTVLGGTTAYADGTYLILSSTSTTPIKLQDNGTLAGSQLFLGSYGPFGAQNTFVILSSSMTHSFIYNASEAGWNLVK